MKSKPNISSSTRKQTGLLASSRLDKITKDSGCQPKVHHQAIESEDHSMKDPDSCLPTSYDVIGYSEAVGLADIFPDVSLLVSSSYLPDEALSPPLALKECIWQELLFSCPVAGCEYTALPALISEDADDNSTISCDEKNCNSESFHVTNGNTVGPVGLSAEEDLDQPVSSSVVGCEYMIPEMVPDATETCMLLPFLEEIIEATKAKSLEEALASSDDAYLFLALQEAMLSPQAINHSSYGGLDHVECFDPDLLIANFSNLPEVFPSYLPVAFPMQMGKRKPNTLVLDLDETLIHSSLDHCPDADFSFSVCVNMREHLVYVRQRPHLHTFLGKVAEMFEIVIFTASQSIYADQLLNILDPDNKIISQRFYREACVVSDGRYIKDLTVLRHDLAKVVIIDNTPQVFQLQVNNGIPIQSWFDDPTDCALLSILPFLEILASADDVRPIIASRFEIQSGSSRAIRGLASWLLKSLAACCGLQEDFDGNNSLWFYSYAPICTNPFFSSTISLPFFCLFPRQMYLLPSSRHQGNDITVRANMMGLAVAVICAFMVQCFGLFGIMESIGCDTCV